MAERVGFEPTCPLQDNLISSQARYGQLRYLSAFRLARRFRLHQPSV